MEKMSLLTLSASRKLPKTNFLWTKSTLTAQHFHQPRLRHHKTTRHPSGKSVPLKIVVATTAMMQDHAASFSSVNSKTQGQSETTQMLKQAKEMFGCAVASVLPVQMIRNVSVSYNI